MHALELEYGELRSFLVGYRTTDDGILMRGDRRATPVEIGQVKFAVARAEFLLRQLVSTEADSPPPTMC